MFFMRLACFRGLDRLENDDGEPPGQLITFYIFHYLASS